MGRIPGFGAANKKPTAKGLSLSIIDFHVFYKSTFSFRECFSFQLMGRVPSFVHRAANKKPIAKGLSLSIIDFHVLYKSTFSFRNA